MNTPPPKPILDRLPAIPPRPSSKSNLPQQGKEEAARKRLTTKLESMSLEDLAPPPVDPRTAAVAALMVANFISDEEVRKRFHPLVSAKLFDMATLDDLPVAARFVLRILPKLGADLDQRGIQPPEKLYAEARAMRESLARLAERHLADLDDAHGRLVTIRLGEGPADTVHDLRMLADLYRDYTETLLNEVGSSFKIESERDARELAQELEDALLGPHSEEDTEWRSYLLRALAMLVPLYDEVCRAGRFLFHQERPEARFPTLASVARVRRRLKRESVKRSESNPRIPAARVSQPARESIPPEVSLVDVSHEEEQALAGVLVSVPPSGPPSARSNPPSSRRPAAAVASFPAPSTPPAVQMKGAVSSVPPRGPSSPPAPVSSAPPAKMRPSEPVLSVAPSVKVAAHRGPEPFAKSPSVPVQKAVPASMDLIEAVTLDFSPPGAAEDADANPDTADIDLEITYASESNFYADVAGNDLGLFVATFVVKAPGTPLAVRLTVPSLEEPIMVSGTVRWVREFSPSIEAPPGMGVALRPVAARGRAAIDAFMKVRPPLLHDE